MAEKKLHSVLVTGLLALHYAWPAPGWAQSAPTNLDLASTDRTIVAGDSHTITVGSESRTVNHGDLLTPAEYVALTQVIANNGQQSIVLAGSGNAIGGSFVLSGPLTSGLSSLVIPQAVSVIQDFAGGALQINGNFTNNGNFFAISTNSAVSTASISAINIFNQPGGVLSSVLPTGGLAGFGNAISGLNLSLFAHETIFNSGIISSAGSLSMTATSIVNALPAGVTGPSPIMQAMGDINLITSQITNAGLINSLASNINIASITAQNMAINNIGGRMEALNGLINVRDQAFMGKFHLDMIGGNYASQEMNLFSGDGIININVNEIAGTVNILAGELYMQSSGPLLSLGDVMLSGDPTITNPTGDILLQASGSANSITTNGALLHVTAGGNIIATGLTLIDTAGGEIVMTAGGFIDLSSVALIKSTNSSGVGNHVQLTAAGPILLNEASTIESGSYIQITSNGGVATGNLVANSSVVLTGTNVSTGNITLNGDSQGGVNIHVNSGNTFVIGNAGNGNTTHPNGINGTVSANGSTQSGFLFVANAGSGGIHVNPSAINVSGAQWGGEIALDAGTGTLSFGSGTLSTHGGVFSGPVFLTAQTIDLGNAIIDVSSSAGGLAGGIYLSSSNLIANGAQLKANDDFGLGFIQVMASDSINIDAFFGGGMNSLSAGGTPSGNNLSISGSSLTMTSQGSNSGGTINILTGGLTNSADVVADASGIGSGMGGSVYLNCSTIQNPGSIALVANGGETGNGGTLFAAAYQSDLTIANGSGGVSFSASGGSSFGNGGVINVTAGNDLNVDPNAITITPGEHSNGGMLTLSSSQGSIIFTDSGTLSADGKGIGYGGLIRLFSDGLGSLDLSNGGIQVSANGGTMGGGGGLIFLESGGDVLVNGTISANGYGSNSGGIIILSSGIYGPGTIVMDGSLSATAEGEGAGGFVGMYYNTASGVVVGGSSADFVSVDSGSGLAGNIELFNFGGDLNVTLNASLSAKSSDASLDGNIVVDQTGVGAVNIQGQGAITANLQMRGNAINVQAGGAGSEIGISTLQSTSGNVTVRTAAEDGSIVVLDNATVSVSGGDLTLGARTVVLGLGSTMSLASAGLIKIDSGAATNDLTLVLPGGGAATITMGGGDVRPGTLLIGPTGSGNLQVIGSGADANLDITGATVSMSTGDGSLLIGSGTCITTDAFDQVLDFGMELASGSGNISVSGDLQASQLSMTTAGGNITLNSDINAPDVRLSVSGTGSIVQTAGSVGIGSLTLSSELGDIGSQSKPFNTNVLEVKVTSTSNVYLNNSSSLDLKTSSVFGDLSVTANGDIAVESQVFAHDLTLSSTGSISVFNSAEGRDSVSVDVSSGSLNVAAGGRLFSTNGDVGITGGDLTVDGSITTSGGAVNVNGGANAVSLTGAGSIDAGSNGSISVSGASIAMDNGFVFNVGTGSVVSLNAAQVSVGSGQTSELAVNGGGSLSIVTSALTVANGSTISSDAGSGSAINVSSQGALAVSLTAPTGAVFSSGGGLVEFTAADGNALTFHNNGQVVSADLVVNGGSVATNSSAGDTSFNGVNLVANNNVTVTVDDATLSLNGDIESSANGGVISLVDPDGITIAGTGNVGFTGGASGTINMRAFGAGHLVLTGTHTFDAGTVGTVNFTSENTVQFSNNSTTTVHANTVNINSPNVSFGNGAVLNTGSAALNVSSSSGSLNVVAPSSGTASIQTTGGLSFTTGSGSPITFATGGAGTININGSPTVISTSNASVTINSGVTLESNYNITVSTPGGLFVNNGTIITPSDVFTLQAAGALLVDSSITANDVLIITTANNGNITLAADITAFNSLRISAHGSGNILQTAGTLTAGTLVLESGSGNIGSASTPIQLSAGTASVTTTGNVYLAESGNTSLGTSNVGSMTLTSTGGIDVAGTVSGNSLNLSAQNGNIGGNGSLVAGNLTLRAKGDIGTSSNSIEINANTLDVKDAKTVYLTEANSVLVERGTVRGSFNLTTGGNLTVDDIFAHQGSVTLISGGSINLLEHGSVRAGQGNIIIRSTNTSSGTITLGAHSIIDAFSNTSGSGNVTIVIGNIPTTPVKGSAPKDVKVSEKWGGNAYFGTSGISVGGGKNEVNAWGSNVIFSTGSRPSSAIKLMGFVKITADPPPADVANAALIVPSSSVSQSPIVPLAPAVILPQILSPVFTLPSFDAVSRISAPTHLAQDSDELEAEVASKENLVPIAHVAAAVAPISSVIRFSSDDLAQLQLDDQTKLVRENGKFTLKDGSMIIAPKKNLVLNAGGDKITLAAGSVVLIRKGPASTEIFNLCESRTNSVKVELTGHDDLHVAPGARLAVSVSSDDLSTVIASRNSETHTLQDGRFLRVSEFSTLSLIERERMLAKLFRAMDHDSKKLSERILRFAACLHVVTSAHGAYQEREKN